MKQNRSPRNQLALKAGSYSLTVTVVVLAILIVVNIFALALPDTVTKYDISSNQLYSVTSNTKAVVNNLQQDITIYWVVQSNQEDTILENLLGKYDGMSSHINVVKKNPDVFPTFTEQYTDEDVPNNSLIVESEDRYRYISYEDIYITEYDYSSYSYVATGFDGESAITSAIDYVVTDDLPQLYILEGHGEGTLPTTFSETIAKENMNTSTLSLLTVDAIPEDADVIMIYAPQSDISEEELNMLVDYTDNGGSLLVMAGPVNGVTFTNLNTLLTNYDITFAEGFVIEGSRDHYAFSYPYILMPEMTSSSITDSLIDENYSPILPLAQGLSVPETSSVSITALMTTSEDSFSKVAGFQLNTYSKEDDDIVGPFTLGVHISNASSGQIIWFSASDFLNDTYNAYSSGANVELAVNALATLVGDENALSIRSKSFEYSYLTISESNASLLKTLMIGVFPLGYLGIGICAVLERRSKQK